ncbi:MAG: hypothetical protein A3F83_14465 [Candidatus Glassbacteria bacterium RIFCSPLOWO2_12_FULL_58_11]|uniref:TNase-like domain-containing protein n=1 Tax=Candidatus Glassbacteria bacterium RIFCSPLOWO2_12_FULL_58_11 TaxID=1817867 RepID=A0A1F5YSN6_9BACT|nr:MAG: hypothetical protein A3F83_14465 [Candidatus Glassbacteria bacterium RIFCSPLOWO2_12_FULL_58_11]
MARLTVKLRLGLLVLLLLAACRGYHAPVQSPAAAHYPHYSTELVRVDKTAIRVVDGDTFHAGDLTIRVLGIDTPETVHRGQPLGQEPFGGQASALARKLLSGANTVEYLPAEKDRYGRLLAHVFVDGELLAIKLIEASLAYETVSHYGDNGFPDLAREIETASQKSATPAFMEPYRWRKLQREEKAQAAPR